MLYRSHHTGITISINEWGGGGRTAHQLGGAHELRLRVIVLALQAGLLLHVRLQVLLQEVQAVVQLLEWRGVRVWVRSRDMVGTSVRVGVRVRVRIGGGDGVGVRVGVVVGVMVRIWLGF